MSRIRILVNLLPYLVIVLFTFCIYSINGIIPYKESEKLYASTVFGLCIVLLYLIIINKKNSKIQITKIKIVLALTILLGISIKIFMDMIQVYHTQFSTAVFFPFWIQGKLAHQINEVGGKAIFIEKYGPDITRDLIEQFCSFSMPLTRLIYILGLCMIVLPISVATLLKINNKLYIMPTNTKPEIFFSYAWGEELEKIVDELYESLEKEGKYTLFRDKKDIAYTGLISDFMKRIGKSNLVVVVISDKYLRSPFCMFEFFELYRNSNSELDLLLTKIFPIKIESINLNDPNILHQYFEHWDGEFLKWKKLLVDHNAVPPNYNRILQIKSSVKDLLPFLGDINTKTVDMIRDNNFELIKNKISINLSLKSKEL